MGSRGAFTAIELWWSCHHRDFGGNVAAGVGCGREKAKQAKAFNYPSDSLPFVSYTDDMMDIFHLP